MCVIITIPAGKTVPFSHLRAGNVSNPHGWGLAARLPDGSMVIERGFSSNHLIRAYRKHEGNDIVVHCRIGTSGKNDLSNTHPFEIVPGVLLFHNGIFSAIRLTNAERSDTWHLAQILKPLFEQNPDILQNTEFLKRMESYCTQGYSNKLVFLTRTGLTIINAQAGQEREGLWYSNCTAFPSPQRKIIPIGSVTPLIVPGVSEGFYRHGSQRKTSQRRRLLAEADSAREYAEAEDAPTKKKTRIMLPGEENLPGSDECWKQHVNKKYGVTDGIVRGEPKQAVG